MPEIKNRMYFFTHTRESLGRLVAYRSDAGNIQMGEYLETVFDICERDRALLADHIRYDVPFMAVIAAKDTEAYFSGGKRKENQRSGVNVPTDMRRAVVIQRAIYDSRALYCATELLYPFDEVCRALGTMETDGMVFTSDVEAEMSCVSGTADDDGSAPDAKLCRLLCRMYEMFEASVNIEWERQNPTFGRISEVAELVSEFVDVQLELRFSYDEDIISIWSDMKFSWQKYIELLTVFSCMSRQYAKSRVLKLDVCQCFQNFRMRFMVDQYSAPDLEKASAMIAAYAVINDISVSTSAGGYYECIPSQMFFEVQEVKEEPWAAWWAEHNQSTKE